MNDILATRSDSAVSQAELDALREATTFQRFAYGCVRVSGSFFFNPGLAIAAAVGNTWHRGPVLLIANHQSSIR